MHVKLISLYASVMRSGKTEVANRLVEEHGFTLVKFAEPLKEMARSILRSMMFDEDTIERMIDGDLKEKPVPGFEVSTPRHMMQTLGTEWGREAIENDLWIKLAMRKAQSVIDGGGRVVIDDMRFPNEMIAVQNFPNSMAVKVDRPDAKEFYGTHSSEGLLEGYDFDAVILNDDSLEVLRQSVDFFIAALEAGVNEVP